MLGPVGEPEVVVREQVEPPGVQQPGELVERLEPAQPRLDVSSVAA
jgi:hypothetical protein